MRFVGGNDGRVFVLNPGVRPLGMFEWGVKPPSLGCINLAKALLHELDPSIVDAFYMRFMHRTVMQWIPMQPWTKTDEELLMVVKQIEQVENETAKLRDQMARERPVVQLAGPQLPGKQGYGSNDSAPDRRRR